MNEERSRKVGMCLDSSTKFTHFTPLSSEVRQPIGSFSFSKFFRRNKDSADSNTKPVDSTLPKVETRILHKEAEPVDQVHNQNFTKEYWSNTNNGRKQQSDVVPSSSQLPVNRDHERDIVYTRSLTNVLRRISSIRDKRSTAPQSYKDSDFKQYWMPDSNCKECYECGDKFTTFRRRHHCRVCGQIFCSRCCNQAIPGKLMGYSGDLRVCTHCCRIVLSYIQSSELGADLKTLQEELRNKLILLNPFTDSSTYDFGSRTSLRRKNSVGFREEEFARMRYSSSSDISFSSSSNFMSVDQMSTERKILAQDSVQLRELWGEMQDPVKGVEFQNHRHRLRTFPNCVVGKELVDWLISMDKASNREQATAIGQALVDAKLLDCVTNQDELFLDEYALYKPSQHVSIESPILSQEQCESSSLEESQDPSWVKEICPDEEEIMENELDIVKNDEWSVVIHKDSHTKDAEREEGHIISSSSMFTLQLDIEENRAILTKPKTWESNAIPYMNAEHKREFLSSLDLGVQQVHQNLTQASLADEFLKGALPIDKIEENSEEITSPLGWNNPEHLHVENGEKLAYERLMAAYSQHEHVLLRQLLSVEGLSMTWYDIIIPIVHKISGMVRPDVKNDNDEMDIRQYVQFKKIPGGKKSQCSIISGAVCSKNIAHKKMRNKIQNPSILILSSPIVYQRQENKLLSLDPLVMQEYSYLKNVVLKIASFKPDIVLVEKTVSRLAQDFLLEQGITLVLNVKPSVIERVARCTQACILSSVDVQITRPQLGMCPDFYVLEHQLPNGKTKTLMYFDGCATHLGCTVTLRGATNSELRRVKKIMQFMVYVAYNRHLERSFLMDEFAMPPASPDEMPLIIGEDEFESCDDELQLKDDDSSVFIEKITIKEIGDSEKEKRIMTEALENEKDNSNDLKKDTSLKLLNDDGNDIQSRYICDEPTNSMKNLANNQNDGADSDSRILKITSHQIDDFSDPLHTLLHSDDEHEYRQGSSQLHVASLPCVNTFKKALDDMILSCSPYMKYSVPYLESEQGRNCELRHYFLDDIYWSIHFHKDKAAVKKKNFTDVNDEQLPTYETVNNGYLNDDVIVTQWHPFITHSLTRQFNDDLQLRGLLTDFRARGGRIHRLCPHQLKEKQKEQKNVDNMDIAEKENLNNAGLLWERQVDALDPFYHQRLVVLFCSYSHVSNNTPNFCVNPRIVNMDFYGCNDITLGGFLERYCFRQAYSCPSPTCETPMTDHIRKFAHENGCVQILLRQMENPSPVCQNTIAMWSWCRYCSQSTPFVPMSLDSWSFSFAKYLELRFHGKLYTRRGVVDTCCHSLHHDHYQYFGYKDRVVAFKYSRIILREFAFPPLVIVKKESPIPHSEIIDEIKRLAVDGNDVYSNVHQWLIAMNNCYANTKHEAYFVELITQQKVEHNIFREKIEEIQLKLTSPTLENNQMFTDSEYLQRTKKDEQTDACELMWKIHDCVVNVKRLIAEAASSWNLKKQEFIQQRKKEERPTRLASGVARLISTSGSTSGPDTVSPKSIEDGSNLLSAPGINLDSSAEVSQALLSLQEEQKAVSQIAPPSMFVCECGPSSGAGSVHSEESDVFCSLDSKGNEEKYINIDEHMNAFCKDAEISGNTDCLSHSGSDPILAKSATPPSEMIEPIHSSPKAFAKKRSLTDFTTIQNFILKNFTEAVPEIDIISDSINNASELSVENRKTESRGHERSRSEGDGRLLSDIRLKIPLTKTDEDVSDAPRIEKKAGTVKTRLSQMLSSTPIDTIPIPFPPTEHHLLPACEKVAIVVYENEIGSIIAYALSSHDYEQSLQELRAALSSSQRDSLTNSPITRKKNVKTSDKDPSLSHDAAVTTENTVDEKDNQLYSNPDPDKMLRTNNTKISPEFHITVEFADSTSKFYCKVYFAEQFRKLRKFIYPYGEEAFIRSLSRCINWQAKGGKSGLTFCKTQDDRFILKQMSRLEFQSFMDFAPHYFQHIMRGFADQKPTVLAKIVGVYRISYKNSQTNAASRLELLVIENLFYSRNIVQKFDLKGSVRNRLVNTTGKQEGELVLLDENLLKMTCDNPLYIRPHSKTVLSLAINNDTQFLSRQHIMDYSLLVGIDEDNQELVIGIIDYVRTFTFDKKIEMVVKSSGFLGGQGKMPTVVSPELYRKRFCEAMDRYFLHVPDRWSGLGRGVDC